MMDAAEATLPGAVVGKHRVHLVGHGLDEIPEEVAGNPPCRLLVQLDESELAGAIYSDDQVDGIAPV